MIQVLAVNIFLLGYLAITLEHKIKINKSAAALMTGGLLWLLVPLFNSNFQDNLLHTAADIFEIVAFLLAAMSLVEILIHYKFFDLVRDKIFSLSLSERGQFIVISTITFFLSAIIDNLTCTIVMTQISRKFFQGRNLLYAVASVVIAANAGGAFSPIGDVTTIMLWLEGKFTALEVISKGFLPALALFATSTAWMSFRISKSTPDSKEELKTTLSRSEKIIVGAVLGSFLLPLALSQFSLPPYLGLLIGLGVVWILIDLLKQFRPKQTHLDAVIEEFIKKTDIASLKFFIGILLAVSALESLHILDYMSHFIYGTDGSLIRLIGGNVVLGFLSAVLDNVPLTALTMDILHTTNSSLWVLLALTAGTGGSLLIIGSAAGVIAMGMIKELNFGKYLQIATLPALLGYLAAVSVWLVQFFVFKF